MFPWTAMLRSVHHSAQVCGMKNRRENTLEIRAGASSIAFKVKILFGGFYSIFISISGVTRILQVGVLTVSNFCRLGGSAYQTTPFRGA